MNGYIHWKTLKEYIKDKYDIDIVIKPFENDLKEMYFICKEECDLSVVIKDDNGIMTYLNSDNKRIPAENIFAELFNTDIAYDEKGIMIYWKTLDIEFGERGISLKEIPNLETQLFYNKADKLMEKQETKNVPVPHEEIQMM